MYEFQKGCVVILSHSILSQFWVAIFVRDRLQVFKFNFYQMGNWSMLYVGLLPALYSLPVWAAIWCWHDWLQVVLTPVLPKWVYEVIFLCVFDWTFSVLLTTEYCAQCQKTALDQTQELRYFDLVFLNSPAWVCVTQTKKPLRLGSGWSSSSVCKLLIWEFWSAVYPLFNW